MKGKIIIILLLLLILPLASAVEFDMKSNFSQGETLMAKLSGNFLKQPFKEDVKFYRGHVEVPIEANIAKINDEFYIYAILPENEANYSIVIENVKYYKGSLISEENLVKNFSITGEVADFSVNPGFVISKDDFFVKVQNLQDYKLDIQIKTKLLGDSTVNESKGFFASLFGDNSVVTNEGGESSVTLKSGEIEKINFKLESIESPVLKIIILSSGNTKYEIPVSIFLNESKQKVKDRDFEFEPSELNFSMTTNSNFTKIIYLSNKGGDDLKNISLEVSDSLKPYVSILPDNLDDLKKDQQAKIELKFEADNEEKIIQGSIKAKESSGNEDIYAYVAVNISFVEEFISSGQEVITKSTKTCQEMEGVICIEKQECNGEIKDAKDDKCCIGTCEVKVQSSTGKIIGWLIIIGIVCFLIWFFKFKYRGAKRDINLFKIRKRK